MRFVAFIIEPVIYTALSHTFIYWRYKFVTSL